MKKYIDIERFKVWLGVKCRKGLVSSASVETALSLLKYAPVVDAEETRYATWQQNPHCKRIYFCSECGRHVEDGSFRPYDNFPYCHCGAKMCQRFSIWSDDKVDQVMDEFEAYRSLHPDLLSSNIQHLVKQLQDVADLIKPKPAPQSPSEPVPASDEQPHSSGIKQDAWTAWVDEYIKGE